MSSYKPQSPDTRIEAERLLLDRYRTMTPAEKLRIFGQLSRTTQELALAGLRRRHPGASSSELRMRLAATRIDPAAMKEAFGWPQSS